MIASARRRLIVYLVCSLFSRGPSEEWGEGGMIKIPFGVNACGIGPDHTHAHSAHAHSSSGSGSAREASTRTRETDVETRAHRSTQPIQTRVSAAVGVLTRLLSPLFLSRVSAPAPANFVGHAA